METQEMLELNQNQLPVDRSKLDTYLRYNGDRFGENPLYIETQDCWKIWDRQERRWVKKYKCF